MNKIESRRQYRLKNKEKLQEYAKSFDEANPWYRNYRAARKRCYPSAKYGRRGIKFLMTISDFEFLWKRDKAHLMKRPTINRIISHSHYTLKNCEFMEFDLNVKQEKHVGWRRYKSCSICKTTKFRHNAKGICISCYMIEYHQKKGR